MKLLTMVVCCCLPLKNLSLTSPFGYRVHPLTHQYAFHNGVDLRARHDTVFAVFDGTASVGYDEYLGLFITIADSDFTISYGHLSAFLINPGPVTCGQPIAITGATGRVTGEHLHLTIRYKRQAIDPLKFLYELTLKPHTP